MEEENGEDTTAQSSEHLEAGMLPAWEGFELLGFHWMCRKKAPQTVFLFYTFRLELADFVHGYELHFPTSLQV